MNNSIFDALRAELGHADPLCPYITVERLYLRTRPYTNLPRKHHSWRLPASSCKEHGRN